MTTITATSARNTVPASVRAGLALSALIGLGNLPFLSRDIDWGGQAPPYGLLVLGAAIGMVSVVCAVVAWNSGSRAAIRLNAAALIVNALMVVPGFFVDTNATIKIITAVVVLATLVAVVLMMRRNQAATAVVD